MRIAMFLAAICFCLPIWATEQALGLKVTAGLEYGSDGLLIGTFTDQVLHMDYQYCVTDSATEQITMTFPIWSPGIESINDKFLGGFTFQPPIWVSDIARDLGQPPIRLGQYFFTSQYLTAWVDARFSVPFIIDGRRYAQPMIELRKLRLCQISQDVELVARGFYDFKDWDFDLGASYSWHSLKATIYSDLEWSLGYSTVIN